MSMFTGKKIAVLGKGLEGISSAQYLAAQGAEVTILDQDTKILGDPTSLKLRGASKDIKIKTGKDYLQGLDQYQLIVRSPGFKLHLPELDEAEEKGAIVTSQTKLFFELCPCPIIGITGTKGKGTTSALIYEMLKTQGLDAYLGGNIGKPPFEFLEKLTKDSWVVLELSSFQLQDLTKSPHIAVMLMVTQEHLGKDSVGTQNYHETLEEYIDAKRNLVRYQKPSDFAIFNRDYPASNESDVHTQAQIYQVTRERDSVEQGCFVKDGKIMVRVPRVAEIPSSTGITSTTGSTSLEHTAFDTLSIIDTNEILLPGKHNLENVCAASMAATLAGVSIENIRQVLSTFKGLEHRLELVAEVNGVKYYDDSFSTTPETAIAAIEAFKQPEILILGGAGKNSDFTPLGVAIEEAKNIKAIIGIGTEWERMKAQFPISNFKFPMIEGATNMDQIVQAAVKIGKPGDVVLLSPACTSFDMFKNYKERGEQFKYEVNKLEQASSSTS